METPVKSPPSKKPGCGCLVNLLIGFGIAVLAVLATVWLVFMHSSWPLKKLVSVIEINGAGENLKVTGISGSLSSGIAIRSMKWNDGELADLRIRYSGLMDLIRRKQLILLEVHVGKARLNVIEPDKKGGDSASPAATGQPGDWPLRRLQIDRLTLADVVLSNRATGFTLAIPALEWTGFSAENGKVIFGNLSADTDHFKVVTTDAPAPPYQKRLDCTILPKMHALIRKPLHLVAELGQTGGGTICRVVALDEGLEVLVNPDHSGRVLIKGVNLADYFDAPLPQNITLNAVLETAAESGPRPMKIRGGSFLLGVRRFEIRAGTWGGPESQASQGLLHAVSPGGDAEIRYDLQVIEDENRVVQRLTCDPPLGLEDAVALLFHGSRFSSLSTPDQSAVTRRLPWFSITAPN